MSTDLIKESPKESDIEQYLLTDEMGNTLYAYCKTIYEGISEELLYENYEIKNVELLKKGRSRNYSINDEYDFDDQAREQLKGSQGIIEYGIRSTGYGKKDVDSFTLATSSTLRTSLREQSIKNIKPKNMRSRISFDEMDIASSTYKKKTRKRTDLRQASVSSSKPLFVPIVVCIKTTNPYIDNSRELLQSLISVLFETKGNYIRDIHNIIFSYSDFCSHILFLSNITSLPPFTELVIPIADKRITYYEGLISNYPCDSDISIAHLFSLVSPENIVTLWIALLNEKNIIIHTLDPNSYFYIFKALDSLLFPLNWCFIKGIILTLELLSTPTPYCYGLLKSMFPRAGDIVEVLEEDEVDYLLLTVDDKGLPALRIGTKELPVYPHEKRLVKELNHCCKKAGISCKLGLPNNKTLCEDFAKQVQNIFYKEVSELVDNFEVSISSKTTIENKSEKHVVLNLKEKAKKLKKNEINFLKKISETQSVMCFFDELIQEKQGNFARRTAINVKGTSPPIELLRIKVHSTNFIVMNRLNSLVELRHADDEEKELMILPDKKFNWIKEINRMKVTKRNRGPLKSSLLKVPESQKKSVASSIVSDSPKKERRDFTLNLEEAKTHSQSVVHPVESNKRPLPLKANNERKVRFYGSKGILAFLDEFMRQEDSKIHRAIILEEKRNTLECFRQSLTLDTLSNNLHNEDIIEIDVTRSEGSIKESHNKPYVSDLVNSLIDIKDLPKISFIFNHDSLLLHFSQTQCFQFYLFLGFFYYKTTLNVLTAVKMFIEAFKYIQTFTTYRSYFPIMTFRSFVLKLDLETHKKLLNEAGKIGEILKSIYQERIKDTPKFEEEVKSKSITMNIIEKRVSYLNDYEGTIKLVSQDPNVIIVSVLNDLITLLSRCKVKGVAIFKAGGKAPAFKTIEKQAAGLKVDLLNENRVMIYLRRIKIRRVVPVIVG